MLGDSTAWHATYADPVLLWMLSSVSLREFSLFLENVHVHCRRPSVCLSSVCP